MVQDNVLVQRLVRVNYCQLENEDGIRYRVAFRADLTLRADHRSQSHAAWPTTRESG